MYPLQTIKVGTYTVLFFKVYVHWSESIKGVCTQVLLFKVYVRRSEPIKGVLTPSRCMYIKGVSTPSRCMQIGLNLLLQGVRMYIRLSLFKVYLHLQGVCTLKVYVHLQGLCT